MAAGSPRGPSGRAAPPTPARPLVTFEDGGRPARGPRDPSARPRGRGARRSRLRVLDSRGRVRRGLGLGQELAPRSAGGRAAAHRSLPQEDVAHLLGRRHAEARALEPARGGARGMADRGLAGTRRRARTSSCRPRDRRPRDAEVRRIEAIEGHRLGGRRGRGRRRRPLSRPTTPTKPRLRCPTWRPRASRSAAFGRALPTTFSSPRTSRRARRSGGTRARPTTPGSFACPGHRRTGVCGCG